MVERIKTIRQVGAHAAAILALFALNLSLCWRLFKTEFGVHFNSIEGAFIGLARYISRHWGDFSWFPLWHCGMPYPDTYVPMLHLIVAAVATVAKLPAARAYHGVVGVAYALGAVTLYMMAVRLGASRGAAFLAGLFYSLFSPSAVLMADFARDIGGWMYNRRLQVLAVYGEGPHLTAMTLFPIAILALQNALEKRTGRSFALAAIAIALVFLTNVPGTMALGLAVFCWICAQPAARWKAVWAIAGSAAVLAYAIACYGDPPSSVGTTMGNVGSMHQGFSNSLKYGPLLLVLLFAAVAGLGYLLQRTRLPLFVRFGALYFALTAVMVMTARSTVFELLPQVGRLHLEMEMAVCLLLGAAGWALFQLMGWVRPIVLALCLAPIAIQYTNYRKAEREMLAYADLNKQSEYTSARWLDANMHGGRVYVAGSTSFWLNAFTDTPQLTGCCEQGESMRILQIVPYLVNSSAGVPQTRDAVAYLQALGVQSIVVNGPQSTDDYKDFRDPDRFAALLPLLHQEMGDSIYAIPQRSDSLAHIVHAGETIPIGTAPQPAPADLARYVAAIEDVSRPLAAFTWLRGDTARIRAPLRAGDLVSVQVPWFSGWKAEVRGERRAISRDGLGLMVIQPGCEGDCEITLHWAGRPDMPLAALVSLLALAFAAWLIYKRRIRAWSRL